LKQKRFAPRRRTQLRDQIACFASKYERRLVSKDFQRLLESAVIGPRRLLKG